MSRIASTVLIFLLLMNGMSTVMAASGVSEDLGVTINPGAEQAMEDAVQHAKEGFSPSASVVESFVSIALSGLNLFELLVGGITTAGPVMFINLGFPEWLVVPVFIPLYVVVTFEFLYVATGRSTM